MKGGGGGGGGERVHSSSSYSLSGKRGWRSLAIAVLCLVILSMLVPLVFLLGLHNGFHSTTGFVTDDPTPSTPVAFTSYDPPPETETEEEQSQPEMKSIVVHVEDDLQKPLDEVKSIANGEDDLRTPLEVPPKPKDVMENFTKGSSNKTNGISAEQANREQKHGQPIVNEGLKSPPNSKEKASSGSVEVTEHVKGPAGDETKNSCQVEFGSYCLWCQEHKEEMKDSLVKKMKDLLFVARAYYPIIAKLPAREKLTHEMKQNIQDFEKILSETTTDNDLPPQVAKKLQKVGAIIARAKSLTSDCNNVEKKLRQILDLTEDEAHFHMKQSAYLYKLAVETMPKSLHCLSMRLTVEYFRSHSPDMELMRSENYVNPKLHHYVIFSNNILASSVVINSTIMHSKESRNQVFHVLTDGENYFAMKLWFFRNSYKDASINVLNIEELNPDHPSKTIPSHLSFAEEYRVSLREADEQPATQMKTEYISLFGPTHYLLPELFQKLKKVVVLDDDIVVQQDLSPLWSLAMQEKVIGAVQFCGVRLNQLKSYLGENSYNSNSCTWMSGVNIVDLVKWRKHNLTETYRRLLQVSKRQTSVRDGASLPATLLTFEGLVYPLDGLLALSGLGHDYGIDSKAIQKAAVLHYNGNMKPWLELGIPRYKSDWKRYLKHGDEFMLECNVNP